MTPTKKAIAAGLLLAALLPLQGCVSTVVGAGAAVGVAAFEERSLKVHANDTTLATKIRYNLVEAGKDFVSDIGIEVYESEVLMTGIVKNEEARAEAVKLAWQVDGVKNVYNEIQIADSGLGDLAKDSWITTKLKSRITFDENIYAINYSIETVAGVVYLIGIAQSQAELDKVIAHARDLGYVKRVISHVRIKKAVN